MPSCLTTAILIREKTFVRQCHGNKVDRCDIPRGSNTPSRHGRRDSNNEAFFPNLLTKGNYAGTSSTFQPLDPNLAKGFVTESRVCVRIATGSGATTELAGSVGCRLV